MASLIQRGIIALAHQGPLLDSARRELARTGASEEAIVRLIAEQAPLGKSAKDLMEVDFHPINAHGIIGLWVAVEVAVEDTAVLILMREPTASALVQAAGMRLPNPTGSMNALDVARRIYRRLEQYSRDGRRVAEAYCFLLSILRVPVSIDTDAANVLSELNYVRNCLLHRNGIADDRATTEAPTLGLSPGAQIKIPSSRYLRYFDAARQFAHALLQGTVSSPYVRVRS